MDNDHKSGKETVQTRDIQKKPEQSDRLTKKGTTTEVTHLKLAVTFSIGTLEYTSSIMDGQSDQKLIAQERDDKIALSPAHLYYRDQLATAAAGTDENRIHQAINNAQFFINQSPNQEKPNIREKVPGTMMTGTAIHGDGLQEIKFRCQVPYIAYLCALKGDRADNYTPPNDCDKEIFEDFDRTNFIWAKQTEVSKSLEKNKYLTTAHVPGEYRP